MDTSRIRQRARNVPLASADVCGEGRLRDEPKESRGVWEREVGEKCHLLVYLQKQPKMCHIYLDLVSSKTSQQQTKKLHLA